MLRWFKRRLYKRPVPPIPDRENVVELMFDQGLTGYLDEVVDVLYSRDKARRYVLLKNDRGLYSYELQRVEIFDEDEWLYITASDSAALPAMWAADDRACSSFFATQEDARKEMRAEPSYKMYFEQE